MDIFCALALRWNKMQIYLSSRSHFSSRMISSYSGRYDPVVISVCIISSISFGRSINKFSFSI